MIGWDDSDLDDVLYIPPVDSHLTSSRDSLLDSLADRGIPVLVQLRPGERWERGEPAICDLLEPLLDGEIDRLSSLSRSVAAVWPLVPGYTSSESMWISGIEKLRDAGVHTIQPVTLNLTPGERRKVVDRAGDQGFEELFHGARPAERDFSRAVAACGLESVIRRPLSRQRDVIRENRRIAEILYCVAEIWLGLGRSEGAGQSVYASARRIDSDLRDYRAICREGNLGVVTWLDPVSRDVIETWVGSGTTPVLDELKAEYLADTAQT